MVSLSFEGKYCSASLRTILPGLPLLLDEPGIRVWNQDRY